MSIVELHNKNFKFASKVEEDLRKMVADPPRSALERSYNAQNRMSFRERLKAFKFLIRVAKKPSLKLSGTVLVGDELKSFNGSRKISHAERFEAIKTAFALLFRGFV